MNRERSRLLRGGLLFDDTGFRRSDVRIAGDRIVEVGPELALDTSDELDVAGYVVAPSFADLHTHTRYPGDPDSETVASVTDAAINGGYTYLVAMANTSPVPDNVATYRSIAKALAFAPIDIEQAASVTIGREGERLVDVEHLSRAGARFFTDDGSVVARADLMLEALRLSRRYAVTIMEHAQDPYIGAGGSVNLGPSSEALGLKGIGEIAESVVVARDLELLRESGGRLHLMHLSAVSSLSLLAAARAEGLSVTAEVTPHHLLLNDALLGTFNTSLKVNPPLRSEETRAAGLVDAALRGEFDVVSTDHAPHSQLTKERCIADAPFGLIGLESAFSASYTALFERRVQEEVSLSGSDMRDVLAQVLMLMSIAPRRLLGEGISIAQGARADLVVVDPVARVEQQVSDIHSGSVNSPYLGMELRGSVVGCITKGRPLKWEGTLERGR